VSHLGEWRAWSRLELRAVLEPLPARWWLAGGHALELFAGKSWRAQADIDAGILRSDLPRVSRALRDLEMCAADGGELFPLQAGDSAPATANSVWCRESRGGPWRFELLLDSGDGSEWVFRRDPSVRAPLERVLRRTADGLEYLAPEIQLLYKAKGPRERDEADFAVVAPLLDRVASDWLRAALARVHPGHAWLESEALRLT
jgi:hypothetical protein